MSVIGINMDDRSLFRRRLISGITAFVAEHPDMKIWSPKSSYVGQDVTYPLDGILEIKRDLPVFYDFPDIPTVTMGSGALPAEISVAMDNDALAMLAFEHLISCNVRTIGFLHAAESRASPERLASFEKVCDEKGVFLHVLDSSQKSLNNRAIELNENLEEFHKPVGLFAPTDFVAANFLGYCTHFSLKVPEDIIVLGAGNNADLCLSCDPPLSSIDVGVERVGYEAARRLLSMINGESVPVKTLIAPRQVVQRQSTIHKPRYSPEISRALNFMYRHLQDEIVMEDLLLEQSISRRKFEGRFLKEVGESPMKHLRSIRLHRIRHMLKTTELSVAEIGRQCGIPDSSYLCRLFRRYYKTTPQHYRLSDGATDEKNS